MINDLTTSMLCCKNTRVSLSIGSIKYTPKPFEFNPLVAESDSVYPILCCKNTLLSLTPEPFEFVPPVAESVAVCFMNPVDMEGLWRC